MCMQTAVRLSQNTAPGQFEITLRKEPPWPVVIALGSLKIFFTVSPLACIKKREEGLFVYHYHN